MECVECKECNDWSRKIFLICSTSNCVMFRKSQSIFTADDATAWRNFEDKVNNLDGEQWEGEISGVQEAIMALRFRSILPQLRKIQVKNDHTLLFVPLDEKNFLRWRLLCLLFIYVAWVSGCCTGETTANSGRYQARGTAQEQEVSHIQMGKLMCTPKGQIVQRLEFYVH